MARTSVSVIVCAYTEQRRDQLWQNLAAVRAQSTPPDELVVVVDNNPALAAEVRADWPDVVLVQHDGPRGLSPARNAGVASARGDVLVFLDDDAVPATDCLERLVAPFAAEDVAGVGGRAIAVWPDADRPAWLPAEFDWVVGCSYVGQPTRVAPVRNLMGCAMALRRDVVRAAGGFRSSVGRIGDNGAGCEETELCIRYAQLAPGSWFLYEPAAVVHHHVARSRVAFRYFWSRCRAEGRSKAMLSAMLGAGPSLAAEREYTRVTLPRALRRYAADALRGDVNGLLRAVNVGLGLVATGSAYVGARLARVGAQAQPELVTAA